MPDPYRTLGLQPGASMADVKRAYRRLAKAFHPDSAGEAALPRFLAIHEAYETLRTGRPVAAPPQPGPDVEPELWRADPARARAARERSRTSRRRPGASGAAGSSGTATGAAGQSSGAAGKSTGGAGPAGTSGSSASSSRTHGPARGSRRREGRKATMGSTSYDDARDPSDATWSGASWYGPTTGEYWIVNPREYADPRKHGPDYQSRARRPEADEDAALGEPTDPVSAPAWSPRPATEATRRDVRARATAAAGSGAGAASRSWAGTAGRAGWAKPLEGDRAEQTARAAGARGAAREHPGEASAGAAWRPPIATATRELIGGPSDDPIRRLGLALVAWPPIGLAAAAAIGEVTGCTVYSADCGGADSLLPWLAQAGILGLLLLLPPFARLLAGGTVAVVISLVPVTSFLVVVGGAGQAQAGYVLAFLLALVWLAGVGWSLALLRRRNAGDDLRSGTNRAVERDVSGVT